MNTVVNGFYIIDEQFFIDFPDPYLKGNKAENRPHYFCFKDNKTGLLWVIPLSTKIEKYQRIIDQRLSKNQSCDILHIIELANKKECLLIQDMFPISERYIKREYTISGVHLVMKDRKRIGEIDIKARKILALIRKGITFTATQPDVLFIEQQLLTKGD